MARKLKAVPSGREESRTVLLEHEETAGSARLIRVETGGVDRVTGEALKVYFELQTAGFRKPSLTRTFSGQGDRRRAEYNARVAFLMAQYGVTDFSTTLADIGPRIWESPKNMAALASLADVRDASRTRMDSGDSEAERAPGPGGATTPFTRRPELFREVPAEELEAEDAAIIAVRQR
jgi:hypothetical protein